jgi:hypothetical protein
MRLPGSRASGFGSQGFSFLLAGRLTASHLI